MTNATTIDRRTGHRRMAFQETVQVMPPGSEQSIWARAANLSESGIFLASARLFGVGTEIGVRLPLPSGEGRINLRGRVVRVTTGPTPGMGVAFEALGEPELAALRAALLHCRPLTWVREAKVWFAGTPQPTRVQARLGPDGLRLFCELGFLRLGSPVVLYFPDEETQSYTGLLQGATLSTDAYQSVPRLELTMALDEPMPECGQTWTYWPPPPIADSHAASTADPVLESEEPVVELDSDDLVEVSAAPGVCPVDLIIEAAPFDPDQPVIELGQATASSPGDGPGLSPCATGPFLRLDDHWEKAAEARAVSGAIQARLLPSPELPAEPSVEARVDQPPGAAPSASRTEEAEPGAEGELEARAVDELEAGRELEAQPAADDPLWDQVPAADRSQWSMSAEEVSLPQRRHRGRLWLWLLALCMVGLTVASMARTNLWQRVSDRMLRPPREPQPASLWSAPLPAAVVEPAPVPAVPISATVTHSEPSAPPPAADHTEEPTEPPASAAALHVEPGSSTLVIPIEGSLIAAHHYPLADPDGVAVNLPNAQPRVGFGNHRVQRNGFRLVWVRRRAQGGLHLRVLHDPGHATEVRITPVAVHVTLKRATPPAAEGEPSPAAPSEGEPSAEPPR